jgi:ketosteroid isomerase-like protein
VSPAEVVRRYVDALNRRDLPALLDTLSPDVELFTRKGPVRGHDAVKKWVGDPYKELDVDRIVERVQVAGHVVVATGRVHHVWRESGQVADDHPIAILAHVEDEHITRLQTFDDEATALQAAGLPTEEPGT